MTQLDDLRRIINEPSEELYTDAALTERITSAISLNHLARDIWLEKAARFSSLCDMQEGSSSRKLSQLGTQAMAMASVYGNLASAGSPVTSRPTRLRPIERP